MKDTMMQLLLIVLMNTVLTIFCSMERSLKTRSCIYMIKN